MTERGKKACDDRGRGKGFAVTREGKGKYISEREAGN